MKKILALLLLATFAGAAETDYYYKVRPQRLGPDFYRDLEHGYLIRTEYCYEYAYGEDGILRYNEYDNSDKNMLIFNNGRACAVRLVGGMRRR